MRQRAAVTLAALLGVAALLALAAPPASAERNRCGPPGGAKRFHKTLKVGEVSGMAASWKYPGVGWMIRDSGHPASIYAVRMRPNGKTSLREVRVLGGRNVDWEDITVLAGRLMVVESTQSGGGRWIYEIPEPNPDTAKSARVARKYRWAYPGGDTVNTEASFAFNNRLVLLTKTSPGRLYTFDELKAGGTNTPRRIGTVPGANKVSMARLSPDRRVFVTADHERLSVWRGHVAHLTDLTRPPDNKRVIAAGDNVEGGDFFPIGSCSLVLLSESKNAYRLRDAG